MPKSKKKTERSKKSQAGIVETNLSVLGPKAPTPKGEGPLSAPAVETAALDEGEVIELDSFEPIDDPVSEPDTAVSLDKKRDRSFAVADAIRLLHSLPAAPKVEMVVRLMRVTLGSVNVSGQEMSDELSRRQQLLERNVDAALRQVQLLEQQLQAKRNELADQQAELKQLANVRTKLHVAMDPASRRPPPIPFDAIKPPARN